jgi:hypothetical protein
MPAEENSAPPAGQTDSPSGQNRKIVEELAARLRTLSERLRSDAPIALVYRANGDAE